MIKRGHQFRMFHLSNDMLARKWAKKFRDKLDYLVNSTQKRTEEKRAFESNPVKNLQIEEKNTMN